MTLEELRELDRRVHYEVLDLHCLHEDLHVEVYSCRTCGREGVATGEPMPYSTKIEWAWVAVETLRARAWFLVLTDFGKTWGGWEARLDLGDNEVYHCRTAREATAPLAICRAALETVEP